MGGAHYKAIGLPKEHQLRVYPVGAVAGMPEHFAVNVWNWDPAWKVEWLEDGKRIGEMTRETALDPLSVKLHEGAAQPAKHKWVEPQLTDHLFFAKPSASATTIMVQVKDRFGNIYQEELKAGSLRSAVK